MTCLVCGHRSFQPVAPRMRDSADHRVVRCRRCSLVQISPLPTQEEDAAFYDTDRQSKNVRFPTRLGEIKKKLRVDTDRRAAFVSKLLPKRGRLLDVGSGYGFFLDAMRRKGFKVTGLEISSERRAQSRRVTKTPLITTNLLEESLSTPPVDGITLFHVLEHIREPVAFLKRIKPALKRGGTFIVEVPNVDDALLAANRAYADFYWQRAHVAYYSAKTLADVLRRAGFTKPKITFHQRYGLENFMHWQMHGTPQRGPASHETDGPYAWLERLYKKELESSGRADTLLACVRV